MNICFFTNHTINPQVGGIERITYNLSNYFTSQGFKVYNICLHGTPDLIHFIIPKGLVKQEIINYIDDIISKYEIEVIIDQYGTGHYISHEHLKSRVKIIRCWHTNIREKHITASLLKTFSFKRFKRSMMNLFFWINTPIRRYKLKKEFKYIIRYTDKFMLLSSSYIDELTTYFHLPANKLEAINNAIDLPQIKTTENEQTKENLIIYCGRIVHSPKNVLFLLQLWKELYKKYPSWRFELVGDGVDNDLVEEYIKKYNLERIHVTGFTDPEPYYKRAKILLLPSYNEGFPMVLLESMAYKCVPIVFNVTPAFQDIIQNKENGYIIPDMDCKEYILTCEYLMNNPIILNKMSCNAEKAMHKFNIQSIGEQWIKILSN